MLICSTSRLPVASRSLVACLRAPPQPDTACVPEPRSAFAYTTTERARAVRAMGESGRAQKVCDLSWLEKAFQHSLDPAVCHFDFKDRHVNVIDTPGYPDLLGRSMAVLAAAETAAVVINAQAGIELG